MHNISMIGRQIKVLVEEKNGTTAIGRSEFDSPEVDQEVIIENCEAEPGSFVTVEVTGADSFELYGKRIYNN